MEDYFGMYKPNNWWVYINQDSSKTDSIYISNFNEEINKDKEDCYYWPTRDININSDYIESGTNSLISHYSSVKNESSFNLGKTTTYIYNNDNGSISSYYTPTPNMVDSMVVHNKKYYNIINFKFDPVKTYFAKNVGLIRFIKNTDTFSLKTFYIN